jgi:ferredoxin--NADP+ reductase
LSAPNVSEYVIEAPRIAQKAQAGQFVVVRVGETGERIPLTLADWDAKAGTITLVVQAIGRTTKWMQALQTGDVLSDVLGPLGQPSEIKKYGTVVCLGGGIGGAPIHPIARAQRSVGNRVITVLGVRSESLLFWTDRLQQVSDEFVITSDDGSVGKKGFAVDVLKDLVAADQKVDLAYAIGPVRMMQASCSVAKKLGVPMVVSLNPVMVDGTGMCGGCRVYVAGKMRYACSEGPEFDGWEVDFETMINRQQMYRAQEQVAAEKLAGPCRMEATNGIR